MTNGDNVIRNIERSYDDDGDGGDDDDIDYDL